MEWRKLKNIKNLILLVVNGFLLVLVWSRREESASYQRAALEQTVRVLNKSGIEVDLDAAIPADSLPPLTVERDLDRELQLARGLLGQDAQADNRGGGLYLYQNGAGQLSVRPGGELSAELQEDSRWRTGHPARHAAGLLRDMGLEAEELETVQEDGQTRVRFRQVWNGAAVFSCEVEFVYENDALGAAGGSPAIRSMEPGYRGTVQPLSGGVRLAPVWLVATDTGKYYLDCVTGALTRVT